jgi:hypothetical protein
VNNLLLEMMVARANAQGNPEIADLLARLRAPGANVGRISEEIVQRLSEQNPAIGHLARQIAESQRSRVIDLEPVEDSGETPTPPFDESAISAIEELKEHAKNLYSEVKELRNRADQLAAALGACCVCWGEDATCRVCRGRGAPGFALPDETLFEQYVLPAVMLLRERKPRRHKARVQTAETTLSRSVTN